MINNFTRTKYDAQELEMYNATVKNGNDYSIPYSSNSGNNIPIGYFNTKRSIDRAKTTSSVVIIGKDSTQDESEAVQWGGRQRTEGH